MTITPEIRDTILSFTGIVVSICTGLWTFYNYNEKEKDTEIAAIFSISNALQEIEIEYDLNGNNSEKIDSLTKKLWLELPYRYSRISSPALSRLKWKTRWNMLYADMEIAYEQEYSQVEASIKKHWLLILQMKGINVLGN